MSATEPSPLSLHDALPIWTQGLTVAVDPEGWLVKLKLTVPVGGLLVPLAVSVTVTVQPSGLLAEVVAGQSSTVVVERVVTITVRSEERRVGRGGRGELGVMV